MHLGELLDLDVRRLDDGGSTVTLDADERHLNQAGTIHGGAIATLVDTAMGAAVFGGTDDDERPVTISLNLSYLEAAAPGRLVATARVRRRGSRFTVLDADVEQDGTIVATGTGTFTTV